MKALETPTPQTESENSESDIQILQRIFSGFELELTHLPNKTELENEIMSQLNSFFEKTEEALLITSMVMPSGHEDIARFYESYNGTLDSSGQTNPFEIKVYNIDGKLLTLKFYFSHAIIRGESSQRVKANIGVEYTIT